MEVILNHDVERIGRAGQILKVKDGFARNFLFPNKLAVPMNNANLKRLEEEKLKKQQADEKLLQEAQNLCSKISAVSVTISMLVQDEDKLYGSIGVPEICRALKDEGFDIDKSKIALAEPIKKLGIYEVPLKLHPDVVTKIKIWIVKK
ncbi:MAG TPA: 50S ribosomal protein L9 [Candidatus Omnitrophota bacterium]|nr:50S ribosomal protein L9 [Candidatus Omnitrophota bacterium]HPT07207.1 50S ribosomal protein L9 [Candidatus Omnitrophota bacterium]